MAINFYFSYYRPTVPAVKWQNGRRVFVDCVMSKRYVFVAFLLGIFSVIYKVKRKGERIIVKVTLLISSILSAVATPQWLVEPPSPVMWVKRLCVWAAGFPASYGVSL